MHPTFLTPYITKKYPSGIIICNKYQSIMFTIKNNIKIFHLYNVDGIHYKRIVLKDDKLYIKANCYMNVDCTSYINDVIKIYDGDYYYEVPYDNGFITGWFTFTYKNISIKALINKNIYENNENIIDQNYITNHIDKCINIINSHKF